MDCGIAELCLGLLLTLARELCWYAARPILQSVDKLCQQYKRYNSSPPRRRRLSTPNESPREVTELNKETSGFLAKLPAEIRLAIYQIYYEHSRFVLTREGLLPSKHIAWMHEKDWRYLREDPGMDRIYVQRGVLSFPLTCRQIYRESIDYIYSMPRFECFRLNDALELPRLFLPQRWQAVTSFKLWCDKHGLTRTISRNSGPKVHLTHEWKLFCQAVAMLPRLKRLEIHIWNNLNAPACDELLLSLMVVHGVNVFEVWFSKRPNSVERYTSAPYRLSWHEVWQGVRELTHLGAQGEVVRCDRSASCCTLSF